MALQVKELLILFLGDVMGLKKIILNILLGFINFFVKFMKIKDNSNKISYVNLRNGNAYVAYEIMQFFRGYKYAEKIDGEMSWWKV